MTGCVATAMAQVVYYVGKKSGQPAKLSKNIEEYSCSTVWTDGQIKVSEVTAQTFDYNNMLLSYNGSETEDQKNAVAYLMLCCGASVGMNYANSANGGSSASSSNIPTALKTYFGFDNTTQLVMRSLYSYTNWINLLYHELANNRPILYSGQSSGGGHEFVCDGYDTEDYFHINWGWGGMSDGFFKLSALDPDSQGIGGSSSTDGYVSGQDAVIGLQQNGGGGTILSVTSFDLNKLAANSITVNSSSITSGETVNVTISMTNSHSEAYSGDIAVGYMNGSTLVLGPTKVFDIPAGKTKDCVIPFTPSFTGTTTLRPLIPNSSGGYSTFSDKTVQLTVNAGGGGGAITTDNIDLGLSVTVEGENAEKTEFYGKELNATVTFTNSTANNYSGSFQIKFNFPEGDQTTYGGLNIPANGTKSFTFNRSVVTGESFSFEVQYKKNSALTAFEKIGNTYTACAGVVLYDSNGNKTFAKASSSYAVPSGALSVDLRSSGVTTVTKNSNPNCLYILGSSDTRPSGLTNVIIDNGSNLTAESISLTDGNAFYSPVDFTATNIEFTYTFTKGADGSKGWNTIILPYDVTKVTANGTEIKWFTSGTDSGKDFWLKAFSSDAVGSVYFNYVAEGGMKAYTPYIIALPGNKWGSQWDLSGKTIKFISTNKTVSKGGQISSVTGDNYRFIGSTAGVSTTNIYCLNNDGDKFVLKASGGSTPFRAFFKPGIFDPSLTMLSIGPGTNDGATMITPMELDTQNDDAYYNLNGQRVSVPSKGLYIKNGKKVIIK